MRVTTFQFAGLAGARRAALACLGDGAVLLLAQSFFNQLADCLRARWDHGLLPAPVLEALAQLAFDARMDGQGAAVGHLS